MSLGLPSHLSTPTTSSSFVRALQAIGLTCLIAAFLAAVVFQLSQPDAILWPAMIAIVPMAVLLWIHRRSRSLFSAISFLVVGALCTYWYVITFSSQTQPIVSSDAFSIDLPMIALIMVGGPGVGILLRFAWCAAGYVLAEVAAGAALLQTGSPVQLHWSTFLAFAATSAVLVFSWLGRRRGRQVQPLLHRAARDEQVAAMRDRIESRAAAFMHDTVLSDLAAIAGSVDDRLDPRLRVQIERDLEVLVGEEWLDDEGPASHPDEHRDWRESGLFAAIQEARALGLEVEPTGDLVSVSRLDRRTSIALGLAVKQCLVNVLRHAGTTYAEVVAYGSGDEVSVMVIDAGCGFSEAEAGTDRLGLRHSVRRRMEAVGGSVRVWSTPGRGTSIMIRVPVGTVDDPTEVEARA